MPVGGTSPTLARCVQVCLQYVLGHKRVRVTDEPALGISGNGDLVTGDALLRTSGDTSGIQTGDVLPTLWVNQAPRGQSPKQTAMALQHHAQPAQPPQVISRSAPFSVEELYLDPTDGTIYRNDVQRVKLEPSLVAQIEALGIVSPSPIALKWGTSGNTFAYWGSRDTGTFVAVFRINHDPWKSLGSTPATATLVWLKSLPYWSGMGPITADAPTLFFQSPWDVYLDPSDNIWITIPAEGGVNTGGFASITKWDVVRYTPAGAPEIVQSFTAAGDGGGGVYEYVSDVEILGWNAAGQALAWVLMTSNAPLSRTFIKNLTTGAETVVEAGTDDISSNWANGNPAAGPVLLSCSSQHVLYMYDRSITAPNPSWEFWLAKLDAAVFSPVKVLAINDHVSIEDPMFQAKILLGRSTDYLILSAGTDATRRFMAGWDATGAPLAATLPSLWPNTVPRGAKVSTITMAPSGPLGGVTDIDAAMFQYQSSFISLDFLDVGFWRPAGGNLDRTMGRSWQVTDG